MAVLGASLVLSRRGVGVARRLVAGLQRHVGHLPRRPSLHLGGLIGDASSLEVETKLPLDGLEAVADSIELFVDVGLVREGRRLFWLYLQVLRRLVARRRRRCLHLGRTALSIAIVSRERARSWRSVQ